MSEPSLTLYVDANFVSPYAMSAFVAAGITSRPKRLANAVLDRLEVRYRGLGGMQKPGRI